MKTRHTLEVIKRWLAPWGMSLGAHIALILIVAPQAILPQSVSERSREDVYLRLQSSKPHSAIRPKLKLEPGVDSDIRLKQPWSKGGSIPAHASQETSAHHPSPQTPQETVQTPDLRTPKTENRKSLPQSAALKRPAPPEVAENTPPSLWRKYIAAANGVEVDKVRNTTHISDRNIEINPTDAPMSQRRAASLLEAASPMPRPISEQSTKALEVKKQAPLSKRSLDNTTLQAEDIRVPSNQGGPELVEFATTPQEHISAQQSVVRNDWWQPSVSRVLTSDRHGTPHSDDSAFQPSVDGSTRNKYRPSIDETRAKYRPKIEKAQRKKTLPEPKIKAPRQAPKAARELETLMELQKVFTPRVRPSSEAFTVIRTRQHGHQDSVFASQSHEGMYRGLIDEIISERWLAMPINDGNSLFLRGATTIEFMVRRTGRVARVRLTKTSGHATLDLIALQSIPKRLPKLPKEISSRKMHHQYTFRYINPSLSK